MNQPLDNMFIFACLTRTFIVNFFRCNLSSIPGRTRAQDRLWSLRSPMHLHGVALNYVQGCLYLYLFTSFLSHIQAVAFQEDSPNSVEYLASLPCSQEGLTSILGLLVSAFSWFSATHPGACCNVRHNRFIRNLSFTKRCTAYQPVQL
jgi:hypothetical protein